MNTRRLGLALFVALLISTVVTFLFYTRFAHMQTANRPVTKKIVAASMDIQPGVPVTAEQLKFIEWPANVPISGMKEKTEDVVGHPLATSVLKDEPVLEKDLASAASLGLAAKIPEGMRAVAIHTNDLGNVAGFIFPGSRVDVLVTLRDNNSMFTRTVLQNVQVLSAGTKMEPDPTGKPENVSVVTVLATPEDSELIMLAQQQGTLQFTLRNSGDRLTATHEAVDTARLTGAPTVQAPALRPVQKVKRVPPVTYTVETIAGAKTTTATFTPR